MKLNEFLEKIHEKKDLANVLKKQGKSINQPDNKYDPIELEIGIEVEYEHVDDKEQSKEIAKDHLEENPHYYTQVLAPKEKEVMDKTKRILKIYGYKDIRDFIKRSDF